MTSFVKSKSAIETLSNMKNIYTFVLFTLLCIGIHVSSFWMVGSIFVAGLAWAVIPTDRVYFSTSSYAFNSWRMFMALAALPSGVCVFGMNLPLFPSCLVHISVSFIQKL